MRDLGLSAKRHSHMSVIPKTSGVRARLTQMSAALGICFALFSSAETLHAQTLSGIRGTVTDQSDRTVSDARVSVANADTGVRSSTVTSSAGSYYITDLIPGTYAVTVEKAGFNSAVENVVLVQAAIRHFEKQT